MVRGVFWKKNITVPFTKITNVDVTQGPLQRLFNIGTINVQTAGAGGAQGARPELVFVGTRDLEGIKETIMERDRGRIAKSSNPTIGNINLNPPSTKNPIRINIPY